MFNSKFNRRKFFQVSGVCLSAIPVLVIAQEQTETLTEDDPTAVALGYKGKGDLVDSDKYPNYQSGQSCSACALFTNSNESMGSCAVFSGKQVSAVGWCSAFSAK